MTAECAFSTPSDTEIQFVRAFAGDPARLWAMWTRAEHLRQWWGPTDWTTPVCEVDFRLGGSWFYCMQDPDGNRYCGKMIYQEIDAPLRFTAIDVFTDEAGRVNADMPEGQSSFTFEEADAATLVTGVTRYASQELRDRIIEMGVEAGLNQTLKRLENYLATLD